MCRADEYLRRAQEDEATARLMSRHDYRDYFLEQAQQWRAQAAAEAASSVAAREAAWPPQRRTEQDEAGRRQARDRAYLVFGGPLARR